MIKVIGALSIALGLAPIDAAIASDAVAGDKRYHQSCHACHGAAGKGAASYPKISGMDKQTPGFLRLKAW